MAVSWACGISRHSDLPRPVWWPGLSVCDYFLWAYLKVKVLVIRPPTVHELKVAIGHEIVAKPPDMVRCSVNNFKVRLQECVWRDGKHLDGIIFKTKWAGRYTHKVAYIVIFYDK
jgi:hypothetical protein